MERRSSAFFEAASEGGRESEPAFRAEIRPITEVNQPPGEKLKRPFLWPLELQGKGAYRREDGIYIVRYPRGDVFLSFVTTIHELGHPRQHERNKELRDTSREGEIQTHEDLFLEESDAWERGWSRFSAANPELLASLEGRFNSFRAQGHFLDFERLESLYEWVRDNALKIVEVQRVLFEKDAAGGGTARFDRFADEMEKADVKDFFERYAGLRTGVRIDDREAERAIENCLKLIEKEA